MVIVLPCLAVGLDVADRGEQFAQDSRIAGPKRGEGVGLDLANALARDVEDRADLLQRLRAMGRLAQRAGVADVAERPALPEVHDGAVTVDHGIDPQVVAAQETPAGLAAGRALGAQSGRSKMAERRIHPAIDVQKSGTRRDDLLIDPVTYQSIITLHRMLDMLGKDERTVTMIEKLKRSNSNKDFLASLKG